MSNPSSPERGAIRAAFTPWEPAVGTFRCQWCGYVWAADLPEAHHVQCPIPEALVEFTALVQENAELRVRLDQRERSTQTAMAGWYWMDERVGEGRGAVEFGTTENGHIGVFLYGERLCAGAGDTAYEAVNNAKRRAEEPAARADASNGSGE